MLQFNVNILHKCRPANEMWSKPNEIAKQNMTVVLVPSIDEVNFCLSFEDGK